MWSQYISAFLHNSTIMFIPYCIYTFISSYSYSFSSMLFSFVFFFLFFLFFVLVYFFFFFFFQAEDGIRDLYVTGVQTCALPISAVRHAAFRRAYGAARPPGTRPGHGAGGVLPRRRPVADVPPDHPAQPGDRKSVV